MAPHKTRSACIVAALATVFASLAAPSAVAQTKTIRIAKQFGVSYLPLTIMEEKKLLEAQGRQMGLDLKTEWVQFTGGPPMNEAIISGNLDFASGGVGPLLTIWSKTRGNLGVKGVAALNAMPLDLNSNNPDVKTIKDFTDKDRIALPGVKVSIQAVTLQMAAEKVFGRGQYDKLDSLTVTLSHPDGMAQLLSGKSEITAHFTSAPFMYQELEDKRIHKVLDSYEVLGGPHVFNVIWTTTRYHDQNPLVIKALLAALGNAMEVIKSSPSEAAAIWIADEHSKMAPDEVERIIKLPENEWTITPKKVMVFADFMARNGLVSGKPASWKDVLFSDIHDLPGN